MVDKILQDGPVLAIRLHVLKLISPKDGSIKLVNGVTSCNPNMIYKLKMYVGYDFRYEPFHHI